VNNIAKADVILFKSITSAQTVDKVPGLPRGFSIVVINISMILPVFIKKNPLLINSKVKRYVPCTWYNYPIRRFRL